MAAKVKRANGWQIRWRNNTVDPPRWEGEFFEDEYAADRFKLDVEHAGNDWPPDWMPGLGYPDESDEPAAGTPFLDYANKRFRARHRAGKLGEYSMSRYQQQARDIAGSLLIAPRLYEIVEDDDRLSLVIQRNPTALKELLDGLAGGLTDDELSEHAETVKIEDITRDKIAAWVLWMRVRGRTWKTIGNYHGVLSGVMQQAENEDLIVKNPCRSTELGSMKPVRKKCPLTPAQFWFLYDHMHPDSQDFIEALVGTGTRFGELTAVRKGIDWFPDERRLVVEEAWKPGMSLKRGGRGFHRGETKTTAGERELYVGQRIADLINARCEGKADGDLIFSAPRGGRIWQNTFWMRRWTPALVAAEANGLDVHPVIHDLRHTHVTWLREAKISEKVIGGLVGHAGEEITGRYGGVPMTLLQEATNVIDLNLRRKSA